MNGSFRKLQNVYIFHWVDKAWKGCFLFWVSKTKLSVDEICFVCLFVCFFNFRVLFILRKLHWISHCSIWVKPAYSSINRMLMTCTTVCNEFIWTYLCLVWHSKEIKWRSNSLPLEIGYQARLYNKHHIGFGKEMNRNISRERERERERESRRLGVGSVTARSDKVLSASKGTSGRKHCRL